VFAVLYGFCETMNGNWSQLDITSLGVRSSIAALALTAFWALVTAGRVLFAAVQRWLPSRAVYHVLPFGPEKCASYQAVVAGGVKACYQVGYGIAAFGVGPLVGAGVRLPEIFGASAAVAAAMGLLSLAVAHGRPSPPTIHPRPSPPSPASRAPPSVRS
jgi:hypothetical protein